MVDAVTPRYLGRGRMDSIICLSGARSVAVVPSVSFEVNFHAFPGAAFGSDVRGQIHLCPASSLTPAPWGVASSPGGADVAQPGRGRARQEWDLLFGDQFSTVLRGPTLCPVLLSLPSLVLPGNPDAFSRGGGGLFVPLQGVEPFC